ncbi:hypothetical protein [Chitinophaga sp. Cy-1792]|uniref:hypothetical protein n=1 Tax=Chitinophaga sp. Cy-1792 TaxID=2608339 RepID=UPI0014225EBD|nr:hypothetical protein [Chitinophaga sp. Cy-1792]NIG56881.1 hypothetical protein [Chitinophaga sp. Cy-1792]
MHLVHPFKWLLTGLLAFVVHVAVAQQLRLGDAGTTTKAALLELYSSNQGLLLTRVAGTAMSAAPLNTAPAGMIVFNTTDSSLYVRVGVSWQKLTAPNLSPAYYSAAGAVANTPLTNQIKIITDSVAVSGNTTGITTLVIPSGFYTKILNIQATARGSNTVTTAPMVAVSGYTTTSVNFVVTVGVGLLVGVLTSVAADTDNTHKIYYTITGY